MKDKIFVTFLCATLCVVTNAMGALGDGPGKCKVQVKARPKDAERSYTGNVWLKDEFLFVSDYQALRCGGEDCGDGVEFNMKGYGYVYRCTVTGETGEWKEVTSGSGIDFCKDSKIKQFSVRNAEYPIVHMGQGDEKFDGSDYMIDTKGFCMNADCKSDYEFVDQKCQPKGQPANGNVNGVGSCKVQTVQETTMSESADKYDMSDGRSVRIYGEYMFIGDDEALRCGDAYCGDGVEFKMSDQTFGFRCTVTDGTGKWQQVASGGDIKFCDNSKIKDYGVEHAEYPIVHKGQDGEKFDGNGYAIDTKGFCVNSDCVDGYNAVVVDNNKYECKKQAGGEENKATENGGGGDEIEQLGKWLDEETKKFERSKWRDAEGKFNTARLASDSIAGVVLGTAGGLISSKVIKKKQVENGFEDIKCTIGSQEVADWGDEFQVGIQ
ncbi:MAG: hypothetical protein IJE79_02835 [Alphaproteobacteria bacterium]|nr:hypothetical protein [Alphaproteobacteria bacterium]